MRGVADVSRYSDGGETVNQVIWIVGLVVVVIAVLGFFGLR
jgi:hypothetical protein